MNTYSCDYCGSEVKRYPSQTKKSVFCNRACANAWAKLHPLPQCLPTNFAVCNECGKSFSVNRAAVKRGRGLFCSKTCYNANKHKRTGLANPRNLLMEVTCFRCGTMILRSPWQLKRRKGHVFCSRKCFNDYRREQLVGPGHPLFRGGYSDYYGPNWYRQRRLARYRDDYKCRGCGITEEELGKQLDVHHIKPFRTFGIARYQEANQLSNLMCVCNRCHTILEPKLPSVMSPSA